MTTAQFRARTKDVTRRFGWWKLKPGDIVAGVEKAMGLKKGEKAMRLGLIRIVSLRTEPLNVIHADDCRREGFPEFTPRQFIEMIAGHYRVPEQTPINRIEFEYLD